MRLPNVPKVWIWIKEEDRSLSAWKSNNRLTSPSSLIAWSSLSNSNANGNPRIQSKPNKNFWSPSCHSKRGIFFVCLSIRVSFAWETQSPLLQRSKAPKVLVNCLLLLLIKPQFRNSWSTPPFRVFVILLYLFVIFLSIWLPIIIVPLLYVSGFLIFSVILEYMASELYYIVVATGFFFYEINEYWMNFPADYWIFFRCSVFFFLISCLGKFLVTTIL